MLPNSRTNSPLLFSFSQDDLVDEVNGRDIILAQLYAKDLAVGFISNCIRFLDECERFEVVKKRISIDKSDSDSLEELLFQTDGFQTDYVSEIEGFCYHTSFCFKLSEAQLSSPMAYKLRVMLEFGEAMQIRTAKNLVRHFDSVSEQIQVAILERSEGLWTRILRIAKDQIPAIEENSDRRMLY